MTAINHPPEAINGKFNTGMWDVEWKLATVSDIALAYTSLLIRRQEWDAALKAIEVANQSLPFPGLMRAFIYYSTQRWGDVIKYADPVANAAAYNFYDKLIEPPTADNITRSLSSLLAGEAL